MTYDYNNMQILVSNLMRDKETTEVEFKSAKGGYRKDRETGEEGFTMAGLLMFGKYEAITDQSCAPRFFPDYKEIPADTSATRWMDRVYPDGTWEANLFQFYRRVLPKLQQVIPTPFQLEGNQRRDETPAHEAIREAFANGVDKIMKGWQTLNWKRPYPVEKAQPNKVELIMPLESLLDEKVLSELDKIFGNRIKNRDKEDIMALSIALTEGIINNERLRDVLAMHPADITHLLQRLCKEEFLISKGHGRGTVYLLKVATSDEKVATSDEKVATSDEKVATSREKVATPIPKRMRKEELRNEIIKYCSEWRTASEIAVHVGRNKQYIRNKILPEMAGVLKMLFPKENHPGQKYKVRE